MSYQSTFIIERTDLVIDALTIINDGLIIGRLLTCDVVLNHPAVSRIHIGIKEIEDNFYIFNFSPTNPIKLNGKQVERNEALADGDLLEIGPFLLDIARTDRALIIKIALQIVPESTEMDASSPTMRTQEWLPEAREGHTVKKRPKAAPRAAPIVGAKALDIYWRGRIGAAGKMTERSSLSPHEKRSGKALYNWTPTSDLSRRWPFALLILGAVGIGLISLAVATWYPRLFSPASLSDAHSRATLALTPAIAVQPNASSCVSCHQLRTSMDSSCSSCHRAEAFVATVTEPHRVAGIGCTTCHAEHRGADFRPAQAALQSCAQCHNDNNKELYNGKGVSTPHGGTFGYPVVAGRWKWKGLNEVEWSLKQIALTRSLKDSDDQWRSIQFHAIHLYRVRAGGDLAGNADGEMSCSSCHKSFSPVDRDTPRQTCAKCHNGRIETGTGRTLIATDMADCASCHVEHLLDKRHWNPSLLIAPPQVATNTQSREVAMRASH